MALRVLPLLLCALGLGALAQEPAPLPTPLPTPSPAPPLAPQPPPAAPAPEARPDDLAALKASLESLQNRLRQQEEDGILRLADLRKAQAEFQKKLAALEALPAQMKGAEELVKAAGERVEAQEKAQAALVQARLAGERKALVAALARLEGIQKELQAGPLGDLDKALAQGLEACRLTAQPQFNEVLEVIKGKLLKGPLGSPLRDTATMGGYFSNAPLAVGWSTAAILNGPGWDSDKLKNYEKVYNALDAATRLDGDLKTGQALLGELKGEAALLLTAVEETARRAQLQLNPLATAPAPLATAPPPLATAPAPLEGEAFAVLVEGAFKPLAEAPGGFTPANRDTLAELVGIRFEAEARSLEHRLLLRRMAAFASSLGQTFAARRKEASGRDLPALDALLKAVELAQGRLRTLVNTQPPEGRERAQAEAAGYPSR